MKTLNIIIFVLIFISSHYSQSVIIFEPGTHIEVQTGANINADFVFINGTYSGNGTINGLPIPVELTSFTAGFIDNKILINWQTASETNNMGFEVQKSEVKSQMTDSGFEWVVLGFVDGAGTTTEIINYNFTDINIKSGTFKYRLKQIDFDGKFTFSDEVEVIIEIPLEFAMYQNYPNPFNPTTTIKYQLAEAGNVLLKVYDILGNEVAVLVNEEKEAGYYNIEFSSDKYNISSGVYIYSIKAGDFSSIKKMMLLK